MPDTDNMDLLRRARNLTLSTRASSPDPEARRYDVVTPNGNRRQSRSDAQLSGPPSPPSSEPSPRIHAQLMQNSDSMAMQLELDSRHTHDQNTMTDSVDPTHEVREEQTADRSATEILDNVISDDRQDTTTVIAPEETDGHGSLNVIAASSPDPGRTTAPTSDGQLNAATTNQSPDNATIEPTAPNSVNILPDAVEEPTLDGTNNRNPEPQPDQEDDDAESSVLPHLAEPTVRPNSMAGTTTVTPSIPTHRVTILSSLPADSLASHLAAMITTAFFAPLESFYLRSLARSYLSSRGASAAALRSDIYPLAAWGGGPFRTDKLAYMGKIALMIGIQGAVNASVWGIISGTAIRIGRRWCGWGSL